MNETRGVAKKDVLNAEGYLANESSWSHDLAREIARINDIGPLSEDHWKIINFVRDYYLRFGRGPAVVKIAQETGFDSRYICELFPCGVVRGAYRIAGLPRPPGCI